MEEKDNNSEHEGSEENEIQEPEIPYGKVALMKGPEYYNYEDFEIEWE